MPRRNALAVIRHFLEEKHYRAQDRLPPERELAESLGLTRTQLRSGMKQLEAEGLIWRHVGRGTFFGAPPTKTPAQPAPAEGSANPRELMEARIALEPQLARLAATHATADDLIRLDRCLERAIAAPDARLFMTFDADLHLAVAEASHNTLLIDLFRSMNQVRHRVLWGRLDGDFLTPDLRKQYDGQHRGIVQAIVRRDGAQAENLMRFHLEVVERQLMTVALLFRP
ncbi:MAG TPA: FCD domain-containing protein [Stellaceae bacterium]|jgi:DNA-binding FadR family transcriptional regulator|nr:FCD domain-containing protein [Stellaceae bacterium]